MQIMIYENEPQVEETDDTVIRQLEIVLFTLCKNCLQDSGNMPLEVTMLLP